MQVTYYSHACFQIRTAQGVRLLCDPWTYNPVSHALWQFPECPIAAETYVDQDLLYISHNHVDHFCPKTLAFFPRSMPIVIRAYGDLDNPIRPTLVDLGFTDIIELEHGETRHIRDDLTLSLYADLSTFDSAIVASDGRHEVFHQNDCMLSIEDARRIGAAHQIELALLGLVNSSIYPTFFVMDAQTKLRETLVRKQKVLDRTSDYARAVGAKWVIPCASDMVYLRFPQTDAYLGPHAVEFEAEARLKGYGFEVIPMTPGDLFDLDQPRNDYKPAYDSHEDLEDQLERLRARPDIQALFDQIRLWEAQFGYDHADFMASLSGFAAHLTDRFVQLLAGQLQTTGARPFRVLLALTRDGAASRGIGLRLDYGAHTMTVTNEAYSLETRDWTMVLAFEERYLGMLMAGAMEFDDIRSGWMDIHRPGPFSPEEIAFWHVMMLFSAYRREQGAAAGPQAFEGQISTVFDRPQATTLDTAAA